MALEVSVRELRDHLSKYLRRAAAGEEVVVTSHAKPVGRLCALPAPAQTKDEALARLRDQPWVRPAEDKGELRLPQPTLRIAPRGKGALRAGARVE